MSHIELASAVQEGDRRAALEALRDAIATDIDATRQIDPSKTAPLYRQLRDVIDVLDGLEAPKEASVVDDLASRRANRGSTSEAV